MKTRAQEGNENWPCDLIARETETSPAGNRRDVFEDGGVFFPLNRDQKEKSAGEGGREDALIHEYRPKELPRNYYGRGRGDRFALRT